MGLLRVPHVRGILDGPADYIIMSVCKVGNLRALRWVHKPVGISEKVSKSGVALY